MPALRVVPYPRTTLHAGIFFGTYAVALERPALDERRTFEEPAFAASRVVRESGRHVEHHGLAPCQ